MRIAVCVGCDRYDFAKPLRCAEFDAARTFSVLIHAERGSYHPDQSRLVRSPTVAELKTILGELLYATDRIDVFTFQFAGHGIVNYETLYLALRDTDPRKLAMTGYSFSELVRAVVAARPIQANFVIDACNSGGLGYDLQTVLRGSLVGTAASSGFSFLAAAAADESAWEYEEGGAFTTEVLRAIEGETIVQTSRPFLDLSEIGNVLAPKAPASETQTVSRWALNVQGPGLFVRNPHYKAGASTSVERVLAAGLGKQISDGDVAAIKKVTLALRDHVDEQKLAALLRRLGANVDDDEAAALLIGLANGMAAEAAASADPFAEARVYSVFLGQIARIAASSAVARDQLSSMVRRTVDAEWSGFKKLQEILAVDNFALVRGGPAELYFLPLRIAEIFGRVGSMILSGHLNADDISELKKFTESVLSDYGNSILSISEDQAAGFFLFLTGCYAEQWIDIGEEVVGRLYNDLVKNYGRVCRHDIEAENIVRALRERYSRDVDDFKSIYQSPSDLATLTIMFGALFKLDEALDNALILLDHVAINLHCADDLKEYGAFGAVAGTNFTLVIGEGFWRCIDFRREWAGYFRPLFKEAADAYDAKVLFALANASLSLKDRVPWFLAAIYIHSVGESFCRVQVEGLPAEELPQSPTG